MTGDLHDLDTASTPRGDGIRDLVLGDRWNNLPGLINGGYLLAVLLRGLRDEMSAPAPRVAAISYLGAVRPGPAELHTTILHRGRRIQTGSVTLAQAGRPLLQLTGSFADHDESGPHPVPDTQRVPAPDLPPVEQCVAPRDVVNGLGTIFERVEHRLPPGPAAVLGSPSGSWSTALWQRLQGGRAPEPHHVAMLCDTYPAVVTDVGAPRGAVTVQLTVHLHRDPAPGWIATRVTTRHVLNGYAEEDCELYDSTGRLVAQSRQLGLIL